MENNYKINVTISGRTYPIIVSCSEEEQAVRAAAVKINDLILTYENSYAVKDKQDALAMCVLQFASGLEKNKIQREEKQNEILDRISKINRKLAVFL